ncbi:hypothetical protein ACFQAV_09290 [Companilactobacillus huachuanensis]|uniref:Uncharacterized protein n=1 Tax=Companilactobacillus huachuanensis TaxID=2559914 RepID=A0ABW1RNE4_9LACO|nr:hypothetical protein [Companilactobacillus huachuanensis]
MARPIVLISDLPNQFEIGNFTKINLHHLTTKINSLDKKVGPLVGLSYYQQQMFRTAKGLPVQITDSAWSSLGFSFKRRGLSALIPQRG